MDKISVKKIFLLVLLLFLIQHNSISFDKGIETLKQSGQAFNAVADKAIPAVVHISTEKKLARKNNRISNNNIFEEDDFYQYFFQKPKRKSGKKGLGSGVIVSEDGYILTNYHVIKGMDAISVTLSDNKTFEAKVIGQDPQTDIALIKINANNLPVIKMGDSEKIKVGEWAIAVGSPFGLAGTFTVGVVSAKGRSDANIADYSDLIQTDAAINPGNSGGALLNIDGELIGINTAIITKSGGYMGIGFAVPANLAKRVMDDLKQNGRVIHGWLGIYMQKITKELKKQFNLLDNQGILVSDVIKNGPAEKGGLVRGDIITAFNGKEIHKNQDLVTRIKETRIGDEISLDILRNKQKKKIKLKVGVLPKEDWQISTKKQEDKLGLIVRNINTELMHKYRLDDSQGVVIINVRNGSPAKRGGLAVGDIIEEINYRKIKFLGDYYTAIKSTSKNNQSLLVIKRNNYTHYVTLTL
jgi:serine protease Do